MKITVTLDTDDDRDFDRDVIRTMLQHLASNVDEMADEDDPDVLDELETSQTYAGPAWDEDGDPVGSIDVKVTR